MYVEMLHFFNVHTNGLVHAALAQADEEKLWKQRIKEILRKLCKCFEIIELPMDLNHFNRLTRHSIFMNGRMNQCICVRVLDIVSQRKRNIMRNLRIGAYCSLFKFESEMGITLFFYSTQKINK